MEKLSKIHTEAFNKNNQLKSDNHTFSVFKDQYSHIK